MTAPTPSLTVNPQAVPPTYGFTCTEHGVLRTGMTQAHAVNAEAKHIRDHHDNPMATIAAGLTLDLTAMATWLVDTESIDALLAWSAMTGLVGEAAVDLARWMADAEHHVTAAVIP